MTAQGKKSHVVAKAAPAPKSPAPVSACPAAPRPSPLSAFQQAAGNLAVQAAFAGGVDAEAKLGRPDDPEEGHAERMAERFAARGNMQAATAREGISIQEGRLPPSARREYESFFGADFSGVRIHTGPQAHSAARGLNAKAFTHGSDVYFGAGRFAPESGEGRKLLAHELAHVAQDRSGTHLRRQLLIEGAPDADNDQRLLTMLQSLPEMIGIDLAVQLDGLAAWRRRLPLSYAEMRTRASARYSEQAVVSLESHDAEVLALVRTSEAVQEQLLGTRDHYEGMEDMEAETEAAHGVVRMEPPSPEAASPSPSVRA